MCSFVKTFLHIQNFFLRFHLFMEQTPQIYLIHLCSSEV